MPVVIMGHSMAFTHAAQLAQLTRKLRIPAVALYTEFAEAGGLMAYGPSIPDQYRHAAIYVDKMLRGAKPVEQPTKFELTVNLRTATALGINVPPAVLVRADRAIR